MIEPNLSVTAKINLYYDLFTPENLEPPFPLLISVHGYAAHKSYMMREAKLIIPDGFAVASLQAPNKFWRETKDGEYKLAFGWLNDFKANESVDLHHKFVLSVIEKLSNDGVIDSSNVFLHGFSQACALNFRFAFSNPEALKGIIGVCGGIPSDLDSNNLYSPMKGKVLYLYGNEDEFYPLEKSQKFKKRLTEYLPQFDSISYKAKHEITNEMREDIKKWLTLI